MHLVFKRPLKSLTSAVLSEFGLDRSHRCNPGLLGRILVLCIMLTVVLFVIVKRPSVYEQAVRWRFFNDCLPLRQTLGAGATKVSDTDEGLPTIFAITPTYARKEQKAELTRLSQTFLHVPNFHWLLIEDSETKTGLVTRFLNQSGLSYTHLNVPTAGRYDPRRHRGLLQRNRGIRWLQDTFNGSVVRGVVYFADDDNTYDLKVFEEMRYTKKVSVWPVGLIGSRGYERPIVRDGKVIGFSGWIANRIFAIDMAGFAVNLQIIIDNPKLKIPLRTSPGYQETDFLSQIVTVSELEPMADQCTKVLVWHTQTRYKQYKQKTTSKQNKKRSGGVSIEV